MPSTVESVVYTLASESFYQDCLRGQITHLGRDGMTMKISGRWGEGELHAKLLGRFNASNLLAVLATLLLKGMALDEAIAKLAQLQTVPGRVERFGGEGKQPLVVVDYAHTPDALQQVLVTLREHCAAQLWCVFGCGGDRDKGKRPEMGAIAAEFADQIIVSDDNPRHEDADAIVADIMSGIDVDHVVVMRDRAAAIRYAVASAGADDVVLVAGKGHEDYQQVGDERLPFSDVAQVQQALAVAA
jgi:UDP-N-acetylmuramoyl-L-alanyl-D-glutamate--2,6-diaminopimelate ligase